MQKLCHLQICHADAVQDCGYLIEEGLQAISDTSRGLQTFVENYRKLTQLQQATPEKVCLIEACKIVAALYTHVQFTFEIEKTAMVSTDPSLLRQVLVNLVKNAIEAGATHIDFQYDTTLKISNNGNPIPPQIRQDIFVPFFTTKTSGSGIGLSFSRQLMTMQNHELSIAERPLPQYSVTFVISF